MPSNSSEIPLPDGAFVYASYEATVFYYFLTNGDEDITLTVHRMIEELDSGEVLVEKIYRPQLKEELSLDENIEEIKKEMLPMYAGTVIEAIDLVLEAHYEKC